MKTKINCLDHGFVKILNISGPVRRISKMVETDNEDGSFSISLSHAAFDADDTDPAKTARISFDNFEQERTREDDLRLVNYLMRNHHNTPIEMIEVWLEMKMPIFVARQFVRHRTACINEVSARYTALPKEWYIPKIVGGKPTDGAKQGQSNNLPQEIQSAFREDLNHACENNYQLYQEYLAYGVAPEHARMLLHVNHYTHWVWKQDLHNMLHFLKLRIDNHAQIEAQVYARAVHELLDEYLPDLMLIFRKQNNLSL